MASVYKHPGSRRWYAKIKTAEGVWKGVPLSCDHKGKDSVPWKTALLEAEDREAMERAQVRGELTIQAIVEAGKRIMERNHGEKIKRLTIRAHLENWLKNRSLKISASTVESYGAQVERFVGILGEKADRPLTALTVEMLEHHRDALLAEGLSSGTVILHCKAIGSALEDAHKKGKIALNPFRALDLPTKESEEKLPFTEREVRKLLQEATGEWKTACLFGLYLGARQGDCVNMEWAGINLFEGVISFTPDKQKRGHEEKLTIAMHPVLHDHLKALAASHHGAPKGKVTPELADVGPGGRNGLSGRFAELMKRAGVSQHAAKRENGRSFSAKSFHSFRHTLTTLLAKSGASEEVRRKVTGHKSKEVHQLYTHTDLGDQRKALGALPSFVD